MIKVYDVIVIGAGHAGCEAALAAARMGCRTLLLTISLDNVALMPCNPSIGGPAKGHLVREIDALGGEMARNIDKTFIQIRMLNTGRGPAVQALRAQADKKAYQAAMRETLESQPGLDLKQAMVDRLLVETSNANGGARPRVTGVVTSLGTTYYGRAVVLTAGTSLRGRIIVGEEDYSGGRAGEAPAIGLSDSLRQLGFSLRRLKTGTPPRIDARTIDFSKTVLQPGSDRPLFFSAGAARAYAEGRSDFSPPFVHRPANPVYPDAARASWRPQLPCYLVQTNRETHALIRANLHRAPLFTGVIEGVGPRYCPSIEDKIVRFAHKESHGLFLEPEGWNTVEVYVQGANTSLPEDVQLGMLRSIPALAKVEMVRVGYAIEYDCVASHQITSTLETKLVDGLFLAGQINGTSGYEEAAGQGLIAGINAALRVLGRKPLILRRDESYIGVMIDDLTTAEIVEPYRLFTSRAEFRLLLRQDNADLRLTPIGYRLGLVGREEYERVERKREAIGATLKKLQTRFIPASPEVNAALREFGVPPLSRSVTMVELLRRPDVDYRLIRPLAAESMDDDVAEQVELEAKYEGYIEKQRAEVERLRKLEEHRIPADFDYDAVGGLRNEARQRLQQFRPQTLGQASRIYGVTPADVALLLVHLQRSRRGDTPCASS
ncbi:MAG: tRNA uridine-5-carboxymethylaminomethyl modification enzyme MnmG/GidA [Chloroflexota bacterium]